MQLKWCFIIFLWSPYLYAEGSKIQGYLNVGVISGSFTGAEQGDFSVPMSLDGVGEYSVTAKHSVIVRSSVALDQETGQFKYVYMGLGQRFYFFSRGTSIETHSEGSMIQILPKRRFYVNYDLGISHIQIKRLTDSLTVESTLLDFGATFGYVHQLSKKIGVGLTFGYSKGFPISPVAVDSTVMRMMVGMSSYF